MPSRGSSHLAFTVRCAPQALEAVGASVAELKTRVSASSATRVVGSDFRTYQLLENYSAWCERMHMDPLHTAEIVVDRYPPAWLAR